MFVKDSMVDKIVKIYNKTLVIEAHDIMKKHKIRHLPVINIDNTLIGIVSDRDIRSAIPYDTFKKKSSTVEHNKFSTLKVEEIMTHNPISILPSYTIQDALLLLEKKKIGALPVVNSKNKLEGILSVRDLLRTFINVLGIREPGTLLGIIVEEKLGQLKKIVDIITKEKISLASILVSRHWEKNKRAVFIYLLTNNVSRIKKKLKESDYALIDPLKWCIDTPMV